MPVNPSLEKDRQLVQRLKRREPDAMMDVYDRYGRLLYSIVLRAVNDRATAEDITQESFLRIWNRIVTFDEEKGNLEGWLVTVARNRAFDYLRSVRKTPETSAVSFTDFERSTYYFVDESRAERFAIAESVKSALNGLSRDQREVIELTHFEGMTQTEIAGRLSKPLGTVKGLVRSALKNLRSAMLSPARQVRHDM